MVCIYALLIIARICRHASSSQTRRKTTKMMKLPWKRLLMCWQQTAWHKYVSKMGIPQKSWQIERSNFRRNFYLWFLCASFGATHGPRMTSMRRWTRTFLAASRWTVKLRVWRFTSIGVSESKGDKPLVLVTFSSDIPHMQKNTEKNHYIIMPYLAKVAVTLMSLSKTRFIQDVQGIPLFVEIDILYPLRSVKGCLEKNVWLRFGVIQAICH